MSRRGSGVLKTLVSLEKHDRAVAGNLKHAVLNGKFLSGGGRAPVGGCGMFTNGYRPFFKRCDERFMMRKDGDLAAGRGERGRNGGAVKTRLADACDDEVERIHIKYQIEKSK